jgi:hypothetical protein
MRYGNFNLVHVVVKKMRTYMNIGMRSRLAENKNLNQLKILAKEYNYIACLSIQFRCLLVVT